MIISLRRATGKEEEKRAAVGVWIGLSRLGARREREAWNSAGRLEPQPRQYDRMTLVKSYLAADLVVPITQRETNVAMRFVM